QDRAERAIKERTRSKAGRRSVERFGVDPGKDAALNKHREQAERDDDVISVDVQCTIVILEQHKMPDEAEGKGRHDIGQHGVTKARHLFFSFLVAIFSFGGSVSTKASASVSQFATDALVRADGSTNT